MFLNKAFIPFILFCILFQVTYSQTNNNEKAYYIAFDSIVGKENTALYNGKRYVDRYRSSKDNHRYFLDSDFLLGDVLYNEQPFFNLNLKYDLFEDILITKLSGDKNFFNMVLITEHVDQFTIQGHQFRNISIYNHSEYRRFAESLYSGTELELLKKLVKVKTDRIKGQSVIHEFNEDNIYLVTYNGKLEVIKSKNNLKKLIPEKAKKITVFYKNHKSLMNSNPDVFMKRLIINIDESLNNQAQ